MSIIVNTAGLAGITTIPANSTALIVSTPPAVTGNEIYIVYFSVADKGLGSAIPQAKQLAGPGSSFSWYNSDGLSPMKIQWSWVQMEIQ
jgi:hypothetical protein